MGHKGSCKLYTNHRNQVQATALTRERSTSFLAMIYDSSTTGVWKQQENSKANQCPESRKLLKLHQDKYIKDTNLQRKTGGLSFTWHHVRDRACTIKEKPVKCWWRWVCVLKGNTPHVSS